MTVEPCSKKVRAMQGIKMLKLKIMCLDRDRYDGLSSIIDIRKKPMAMN